MTYLLCLSVLVNILLIIRIIFIRYSIKQLRIEYDERATLRSNTLIRVSSIDPLIMALASSMNKTLKLLREAYNRYEHGDMEIKAAITNISHDIRTPLTAISGYLELAKKQDKSPELSKYLEIIEGRTEHMKKLTEELFEYSVITGGEITEEKKAVNVGQVLEDCIMDYYAALSARGITPEVNITEEKIVRNLYPTYVERIINNLMSNALKYSDGDLYISLSDEGELRFANSAAKLSSVDVNKLFDRFFSVENAKRGSTGLGLSIVKVFADRMNCPIDADYENGKLAISVSF